MVIECLTVAVQPEHREAYVQADEEIWTAALSQYPGFLGKEVWISPDDLSQVVLIVRWNSFEEWQAVPQDVLETTEAQFEQAVGEGVYEITNSQRFQVRRFLQQPGRAANS